MFETKTRMIDTRAHGPGRGGASEFGDQLRFEATAQGRYQLPAAPKWSAKAAGLYGSLLDLGCEELLWTVGGSSLQLRGMYFQYLDEACRGVMAKLVDDYKVRQVLAACGLNCDTPESCAAALEQLVGCGGACTGISIADVLFEELVGPNGSLAWKMNSKAGNFPTPWNCVHDLSVMPLPLHASVQALRTCHPGARRHLWTTGPTDGTILPGVESPADALKLSAKGLPLSLGGMPADDAWWRLRKAFAVAILRGCAWVKKIKAGVHHNILGPFSESELKVALQGPPGSAGCGTAWAFEELAAGDAKLAAELTLLCSP